MLPSHVEVSRPTDVKNEQPSGEGARVVGIGVITGLSISTLMRPEITAAQFSSLSQELSVVPSWMNTC